eukprot:1189722-Prorocentrum_minimum.AAC.1
MYSVLAALFLGALCYDEPISLCSSQGNVTSVFVEVTGPEARCVALSNFGYAVHCKTLIPDPEAGDSPA